MRVYDMADDKKKTKQRIKPKWDINPYLFLLWLFRKTEDDIINEVLRGYTMGYNASSEVIAMANVQSILQAMTDDCFKAVPKMIEKAFLKEMGTGATVETLTGSQNVMIETLSDSLLGNITGTVATTQETAQTLYNIARLDDDIFRQVILENPKYNALMGNVPIYSAKEMEGYLRSHGVTSFVDKAGRKWSLSNYCDMATRTQNQIATNAAILSKDEHDLYKILAIGSTCDICAPLEGRVYSKSGTNPYYPPLASAFGKIDVNGSDDLSNTWLNIHPNCLHQLAKYTEGGKSEEQIQKMREFSIFESNPITNDPRTKKQIEAYRTKERNRAKLLRELRKKAVKNAME